MRIAASVWGLAAVVAVHAIGLHAQQPPPPQPFPRPGAPPVASPQPPPGTPSATAPPAAAPRPPATAPAPGEKPTDASLGIPGIINPKAEFLDSFDLGHGQRCYLFGSDLSYAEMIGYYKNVLKDGGRELFRAPAMQQFDLGRFQEQAMAVQPSVVVKDYSYGEGYLHVDGVQTKRFKTIVQIVPMTAR
jgi:hypothetical protein